MARYYDTFATERQTGTTQEINRVVQRRNEQQTDNSRDISAQIALRSIVLRSNLDRLLK